MDVEGNLPGWAAGFLLLSGTIAVAGVADYLLTNSGYGFLGTYVWAVCYAGPVSSMSRSHTSQTTSSAPA